ncbi:MAG: FG-GAP repeat domain-containing protein [Nitrospinota bacterium]
MNPGRSGRRRLVLAALGAALFAAAHFAPWAVEPARARPRGSGRYPHSIKVEDFNGDGNLDVAIAASGESKLVVHFGDGGGGFASTVFLPVGRGPVWVEAGDLNGDGNLDLLTANSGGGSLSLYYGDGDGGFRRGEPIGVKAAVSAVAADFDGDGRMDLAVAQALPGRVLIYLGGPRGKFRRPVPIA